ncbi:hypothetical protein K439DRAFT_1646586 [Ramaria rubella]|nr:hypothetical protein K439DRAFT_1646586 [Ramaria rubella]
MIPALRHASRSTFLLRSYARRHTGLPPTTLKAFVRTVVTKRYTKEHEMISYDDATLLGRLHITKHAAESLGDVVFVELPAKGREVKKGDQIGAVESVKAASDIYAPVSGTIGQINEALGEKPGLMGSDPEMTGWLCEVKLSNPEELDSLLTFEAYKKFCEKN